MASIPCLLVVEWNFGSRVPRRHQLRQSISPRANMAAGKSQSSIRSPTCAVELTCLPCLVYLLTLSEIPIYLDPNPSYLRSTKRVAYLNHSASLPRLDLQHAIALHLGPGSHRRPRIDYSNPTPTYLKWRSADLARTHLLYAATGTRSLVFFYLTTPTLKENQVF